MDFKKLKGLFVESVEESANIPVKANISPKTPTIQATEKTDKIDKTDKKDSSENQLDDKVLTSLLKAIEKNNLPGEDYIEFMEALKAMQTLNLDEKIKFQTVMATLSTKGLTKARIMESGDYYIKILEAEKEKFNATLQSETQNQVKSKEDSIKSIEATNASKAKEIQKLTEEITKNQIEISEIKKKIEESKTKISSTQNRFLYTFDYLKNQISINIDKIKTL